MENVLSAWPALAGVFQNFVRSDLEEVEFTVRAPLSQSQQPPPTNAVFVAIIRKFDLPVSSLQSVQPPPVHPTTRSRTWTFRLAMPHSKVGLLISCPHPLKSRTGAILNCFHGSLISGRSRSKRWARRLLSVKPRKRPFVRSAPTSALRTLSHTAPLSRVNCPLKSLRSLEPLPKEVGKWWPSSAKGHISRRRQARGPQAPSRVMGSSYPGQWSPLLHYHVSAIPKPAHTRR
jgi:hypothetical protein